ncbi:DnaB-like helicase C-terminal domain-containing protein [Geobacillus sp. FJAT-46040]|uniref:replicative DNA helicase n=1 Tax=Geobacillus sp. FJAT-46040 TaxID=2011017 RepID=UPI000BB89EA7|nr:DnaB-like helicase C-terminal domain-containing protein [Geobacillus sp. FJAT-46040]
MTIAAEKALLGTFLEHQYLLRDTILNAEQLEDERHRRLFETMKRLVAQNQAVDIVTLATVADVAEFGGVSYLNELADYADENKFEQYEQLVLDAWKDREKKRILTKAAQENWPIDRITKELDKLNQARIDDHSSIVDLAAEVCEAPWIDTPPRHGVPTGIKKLDEMTNGWQDGEVTVIAARPSMGKTDVMDHLAKQAGWHGYLPIIFSLEMPKFQLRDRFIASTGGYNRNKMRDPYRMLSDDQKKKWMEVIGRLTKTNIQIFDGARQSVAEMRAKVRKLMHKYPDKKPVIFIDYLTLIRPAHFHNGSAHQQVTEISSDLKAMAKEFSCPVITLAQLNRSVEQRQDKRPVMSDIRESGSVEQDADVIIFLYRDSYYKRDSDDDTMELIVAKNRNGATGTVRVRYNKHTGAIDDVYHT